MKKGFVVWALDERMELAVLPTEAEAKEAKARSFNNIQIRETEVPENFEFWSLFKNIEVGCICGIRDCKGHPLAESTNG